MQSFVKVKSSRNAEITLSFTNIPSSWPSCKFLGSQISFNAIRENEILPKNFPIYSFPQRIFRKSLFLKNIRKHKIVKIFTACKEL